MKNKSNIDKIKIPPSFEGVQLSLQNAERLYDDAQKVSIPTKAALLELSLEEVSKAWRVFFFISHKNFFLKILKLLSYFLTLITLICIN